MGHMVADYNHPAGRRRSCFDLVVQIVLAGVSSLATVSSFSFGAAFPDVRDLLCGTVEVAHRPSFFVGRGYMLQRCRVGKQLICLRR